MKTLFKILPLLILAGCAANPFKVAETLEQKSYAAYGTFVVFEEQGAKVIGDPAVPASVKLAIQKADALAKPAADSLLDAVGEVITIKSELDSAAGHDERLKLSLGKLSKWYYDAKPKIEALVTAVRSK